MAFTVKHLALTTAVLVGIASIPALISHNAGAETASSGFTEAQKTELGQIIKDYLLENPAVIFEAADKHRAEMEKDSMKQSEEGIKENMEWLTDKSAPSAGSANPDVTVVEFFDYNCGYCVKALSDIQNVLKSDANVRFVFREIPILGEASKTAALWALAAHRQGKYFEYHTAVMSQRGSKDEAALEKIAKEVGLDVKKIKKDIASGEVEKDLNKNIEISQKVGVQGTPAFIVGTKFIPGYVGEDGLKSAIEEARAKK